MGAVEDDWESRLEGLLGRLVITAGWAEHSLGELSRLVHPNQSDSQTASWGQSGQQLVSGLRSLEDAKVTKLADRYEELAEFRNKFIHCGWTAFGENAATAWHAPRLKTELHLRSYTVTFEQLEGFVAVWAALKRDVDSAISTAMGLDSHPGAEAEPLHSASPDRD